MLYTHLELLNSQAVDLTKAFNIQVRPQTAATIEAINARRHSFYSSCAALVRSDLKQPNDSFDMNSMLTYLNDGPDLLEFTVKESSYVVPFSYRPVSLELETINCTQGKFPINNKLILSFLTV